MRSSQLSGVPIASSVNSSACSGNRLWMKSVTLSGSMPAASQSVTIS